MYRNYFLKNSVDMCSEIKSKLECAYKMIAERKKDQARKEQILMNLNRLDKFHKNFMKNENAVGDQQQRIELELILFEIQGRTRSNKINEDGLTTNLKNRIKCLLKILREGSSPSDEKWKTFTDAMTKVKGVELTFQRGEDPKTNLENLEKIFEKIERSGRRRRRRRRPRKKKERVPPSTPTCPKPKKSKFQFPWKKLDMKNDAKSDGSIVGIDIGCHHIIYACNVIKLSLSFVSYFF